MISIRPLLKWALDPLLLTPNINNTENTAINVHSKKMEIFWTTGTQLITYEELIITYIIGWLIFIMIKNVNK